MGDWVAHPSNTTARRILVTYPLLAAVSEKVAQNLLASGWTSRRKAYCSFSVTLGLLQTNLGLQNPTEFILCLMTTALWSQCKAGISSLSHQQKWSLFHDHVQQYQRPTSKIDVCVIFHISSWRYGRIVTLFLCIKDYYNLCVHDFASQETCFCDYLCAVQFFVWFTYSLATPAVQDFRNQIWQTLGDVLSRVSFDVICSWFRISFPSQRRCWYVSPHLLPVTKAMLVS
jgi:hypothetical protein